MPSTDSASLLQRRIFPMTRDSEIGTTYWRFAIQALCIGTLLLAGCSARRAPGPTFVALDPIPPGNAVIYVYRRSFERLGYPEIYVDGVRKFNLLRDSYGVLVLPPGEYEIIAKGSFFTDWPHPDVIRRLQVVAGQD